MAPFIVSPILALVIILGTLLIGFITGSAAEERIWKAQIHHMSEVIRDAREMSAMLLNGEEEENRG